MAHFRNLTKLKLFNDEVDLQAPNERLRVLASAVGILEEVDVDLTAIIYTDCVASIHKTKQINPPASW